MSHSFAASTALSLVGASPPRTSAGPAARTFQANGLSLCGLAVVAHGSASGTSSGSAVMQLSRANAPISLSLATSSYFIRPCVAVRPGLLQVKGRVGALSRTIFTPLTAIRVSRKLPPQLQGHDSNVTLQDSLEEIIGRRRPDDFRSAYAERLEHRRQPEPNKGVPAWTFLRVTTFEIHKPELSGSLNAATSELHAIRNS